MQMRELHTTSTHIHTCLLVCVCAYATSKRESKNKSISEHTAAPPPPPHTHTQSAVAAAAAVVMQRERDRGEVSCDSEQMVKYWQKQLQERQASLFGPSKQTYSRTNNKRACMRAHKTQKKNCMSNILCINNIIANEYCTTHLTKAKTVTSLELGK